MADTKMADVAGVLGDSLERGRKARWGRRVQAAMIYFLLQGNGGYGFTPNEACEGKNGAPHRVPRKTLADWLDLFLTFDELPFDLYKLPGWKKWYT